MPESTSCIAAWCRAAATAKRQIEKTGRECFWPESSAVGIILYLQCIQMPSTAQHGLQVPHTAKLSKKRGKKGFGKGKHPMIKTSPTWYSEMKQQVRGWRDMVNLRLKWSWKQNQHMQNSVPLLGTMHKHSFFALKHYPVVCVYWSPTLHSISVAGIWIVPHHSQWLTIYVQNVMNIWECFTPGILYLAEPSDSVLLAILAMPSKINGNFNYVL